MTKTQEIARLRSLVKELGAHSYTGSWLAEQLPVIEAEITSDLPAGTNSFTIAQALAEATRIVNNANEAAKIIESNAKQTAERTLDAARKDANNIRENLRYIISEAVKKI